MDYAPPTISKADLHLHTVYSDGYSTPAELVEELSIPMEVLLINLLDWIEEERIERFKQIIDSEEQLELF